MSKIAKFFKAIGCILLILILIAGAYVAHVFISYERLPDHMELTPDTRHTPEQAATTGKEYTIMTYNIGFGAYTSDYSFFMDGGESSWAKSEEDLKANMDGIANDIAGVGADFVILQEVDVNGTRTYHYDESEKLITSLGYANYIFSQNFDSPFLFWPITEPHGANKSGLLTGTEFAIRNSERRSLPITTSVKKVVDLDRCYSISRIDVDNGKQLCIYDVHLSAYGSDASVREGQLNMLMSDIKADYEKGNYVVCGGDFNHNLRESTEVDVPGWAQPFPRSVLPTGANLGFDVAEEVDVAHNSCRNSDIAYIPGTTFTVLADGFIVTDNVEVKTYRSLDWEFERSDHDPVVMTFVLK